MTASNRLQIGLVREVTPGTTPATPRIRTARVVSESLQFNPTYIDSDEIRSDRMMADSVLAMQESGGGINFELSYPDDLSPLSEVIRSALWSTWTNTNSRDNDGTADSVITDVANSGSVVTCTTGTAFAVGQLVKLEGFTNSANNGIQRVTTASATVPAFSGATFTNETAPPGTAKMKVVGFRGVSGDITATATGLGSTTLDFTTLGLVVGQWVKVGGTATGEKFATAALNAWVRISAIAANALTFDNRPSGWTTDTGSGKTISVWVTDIIKNGTTQTALSIEKSFQGQGTPVYIVNTGMTVDQLTLSAASRGKVTGSASFKGMGGSQSTTALDASYDAATSGSIMTANANVGRVADGGSALSSPNWVKSLEFSVNNNLRTIEAIDSQSPVGINPGECNVTAKLEAYFGDNTMLAKFYAGTASSANARFAKNSQAVVVDIPRLIYKSGGNPQAGGKNQDITMSLEGMASYDSTYTAHVMICRAYYYE